MGVGYEAPEVSFGALGACDKGEGRLRGIEKLERGVSENNPALRPDERGDVKESVRERGVGQEVN
jgi:hypothetical protein